LACRGRCAIVSSAGDGRLSAKERSMTTDSEAPSLAFVVSFTLIVPADADELMDTHAVQDRTDTEAVARALNDEIRSWLEGLHCEVGEITVRPFGPYQDI
jgi:hypothetical protein